MNTMWKELENYVNAEIKLKSGISENLYECYSHMVFVAIKTKMDAIRDAHFCQSLKEAGY